MVTAKTAATAPTTRKNISRLINQRTSSKKAPEDQTMLIAITAPGGRARDGVVSGSIHQERPQYVADGNSVIHFMFQLNRDEFAIWSNEGNSSGLALVTDEL